MNDTILCELFLALADKTRLRLIGLLAKEKVSVGFLVETIGESQPKVSRHLAFLRNVGLVSTERDGKNIFYSIKWPQDQTACNVLSSVVGNSRTVTQGLEQEKVAPQVESHDILPKTYITDYTPNEIEIHLL